MRTKEYKASTKYMCFYKSKCNQKAHKNQPKIILNRAEANKREPKNNLFMEKLVIKSLVLKRL